ncbi:hypothetical protein AB0E69_11300 [Kribbella sp. NPDC026611]|uniref:hypothetical protein n=1 Tax=Kribbella sp. NPDC026611 TaxID=3154911 RepID=UPI0033C965F9
MKRLAALTVLLVLAGCSTVESKDIRTSGITADLTVTLPDTGDAIDASATLRVGSLTFIELGNDEKLTASGGGKSAELKRHRAAGVTQYSAQLDGVLDPGTEITLGLQRGGDNASAPKSTVKLPERVRLTAPAAGTTYSRRRAIPIRFDSLPSERGTVVIWSGPCIESGSIGFEAGRVSGTIPAGSLTATAAKTTTTATTSTTATPGPGKAATTCLVDLTLVRRTEGTLDPAFKDGRVIAESRSVRQISSVP